MKNQEIGTKNFPPIINEFLEDMTNFPSAKEMCAISQEAFAAVMGASLQKCKNAICEAAELGRFSTTIFAERNYVDVMEVLIQKGYTVVFMEDTRDGNVLEISWNKLDLSDAALEAEKQEK